MRKTRFYLCLLIMAMSCAMLGCSDDDNTPEPEPEPEPVPPIVDPEPEPEPEPVVDTVACWWGLEFHNYESNRSFVFQEFEYDTLGRVQKFKMSEGAFEEIPDYIEYVTVEWGEWGNKQVVMTYEEKGVVGEDCKATYTLNDNGRMEKVVVEKNGSKLEEYLAEYTETTFTLYAVKTTGNEKLYSAGMAAGGRYGDWTVTETKDAKVTVDYEDFEGFEGTDIRGYLDILLTTSYAGWLMPKCVLWAHVAAMLPGQTKPYNHPVITYDGNTQELYLMEIVDVFDGLEILGIDVGTGDNSPLEVWKSSPEVVMSYIPKVVTYPVKK